MGQSKEIQRLRDEIAFWKTEYKDMHALSLKLSLGITDDSYMDQPTTLADYGFKIDSEPYQVKFDGELSLVEGQ